jgi:hypothetical protein
MIKLRLDVDYPYPSRAKSFLYLALRIKNKKNKDYLKNARIIARMINESPKQVKAYWFFTPYTIPDKRLLDLLTPERHEVALHVANDPNAEWKRLESETGRTIEYYSIHGTQSRLMQKLWRRKTGQKQAEIPPDFPLKSFHDYENRSLDRVRFLKGWEGTKKDAEEWISQGHAITMHPEWLFQAGKRSQRGPFYDVLHDLLEVDGELRIKKKSFVDLAYNSTEYETDIYPTEPFLEKLKDRGVDIFTFLDRRWCCPIQNPQSNWTGEDDNVGLLEIKDYDSWWQAVGKKTRNMVRKAEKEGVKVELAEPNDKFIEGVWKIYNETPIRQGRAFPQYGQTPEYVGWNIHHFEKQATYIGAYLGDELVGFIQLLHGKQVAIISQILSMQQHWDKSLNNAMIAKAVEVCAAEGEKYLIYGRVGNHPSLDQFKKSNGFKKFSIKRYYIPLTAKGRLAVNLGLHRNLKDATPEALKGITIPVFNWVSRTQVKVRMRGKMPKEAVAPADP